MTRIAFIVGVVLGLALGPGHMIYVVKFSGSQVSTNRMYVKDMAEVLIGNAGTSAKSKEKWHKPWYFSLNEDMNLISITVSAEYRATGRQERFPATDFVARLSKNQDLVWTEKFSVAVKKKGTNSGAQGVKSQVLRQFSISGSDEYALQLRQGRRTQLPVRWVEIEVRRNTLLLNYWLVIAGSLLAFVSIGGLLMTWKR